MTKYKTSASARASGRKYYASHKELLTTKVRLRYRAIREMINEIKRQPCLDCGGMFPPECMDFDHRDPATKSFQIGSGILYGVESIEKEIAKCDLICSNCHRIRTHRKSIANTSET